MVLGAEPLEAASPCEPSASAPFHWRDLHSGLGEWDAEAAPAAADSRWSYMTKSDKDGIAAVVHCRPVHGSGGLCEYMVRGTLPLAWDPYLATHLDCEYRTTWDAASMRLEGSEPLDGRRIVYWEVKLSNLLGRRDYVYEQRVHVEADGSGSNFRCISARCLPRAEAEALYPVKAGVTRVQDYSSHLTMSQTTDDNVTRFAMQFFEDGQFSVPAWVVTRTGLRALPTGLATMVKAGKLYPEERVGPVLNAFLGPPAPRGAATIAAATAQERGREETVYHSASEGQMLWPDGSAPQKACDVELSEVGSTRASTPDSAYSPSPASTSMLVAVAEASRDSSLCMAPLARGGEETYPGPHGHRPMKEPLLASCDTGPPLGATKGGHSRASSEPSPTTTTTGSDEFLPSAVDLLEDQGNLALQRSTSTCARACSCLTRVLSGGARR